AGVSGAGVPEGYSGVGAPRGVSGVGVPHGVSGAGVPHGVSGAGVPRGYCTVMVNCNPETVSTDYDTSDRLYFEPLTFEDVLGVVAAERAAGRVAGVVVQLGGQTPLGLAQRLKDAGVPVLGTQPEAIHLAEDRGSFGRVLAEAGLPAPK